MQPVQWGKTRDPNKANANYGYTDVSVDSVNIQDNIQDHQTCDCDYGDAAAKDTFTV